MPFSILAKNMVFFKNLTHSSIEFLGALKALKKLLKTLFKKNALYL
jgi:hypothetical protein